MEYPYLLSLCMIAKNEEDVLERCLRSMEGVVEEIILVDTGSTDRTVEIARSMGAKVYDYRWDDDFSRARNVSLERAQGKWILFLDADEELHPEDRPYVRSLLADSDASGFLMSIENRMDKGIEKANVLRLFRNHSQHYFVGSFHEQIASTILTANPGAKFVQSGLRIIHYGYTSAMVKKKNKETRNLEMVLTELNRRPQDGFLRYCAAQAYLSKQDPDRESLEEAVKHLTIARERSPADAMWFPDIYKLFVTALSGLDRTDEAHALIIDGVARLPTYSNLYYLQGRLFEIAGKWTRAIGAYLQCLQHNQEKSGLWLLLGAEDAEVHYSLGRVYQQCGRDSQAIEHYIQASKAEPGWKQAYVKIGELLYKTETTERVKALLELLLPPDSVNSLQMLNEIFMELNQPEASLSHLEQLLGFDPTRADILFLSATRLMELGKYADAAKRLVQIPEGNFFYRESRLLLAAVYWFMGETSKGKKLLANEPPERYAELAVIFLKEAANVLEEGMPKDGGSRWRVTLTKIREVIEFGEEKAALDPVHGGEK